MEKGFSRNDVRIIKYPYAKKEPYERGGRGDRIGEYMLLHGWFMSMYDKNPLQCCEVISLQLIKINGKIIKKKKKKNKPEGFPGGSVVKHSRAGKTPRGRAAEPVNHNHGPLL